jgi:(p)ppGpp synthase/HD superfamily hydrolase
VANARIGHTARAMLLEKAIELAATHHAGQTDKAGAPYILHVLRVMMKQDSDAARIVAALHDVVEDTRITVADLARAGFGAEVVAAVDLLTRRPDVAYDVYLEAIAANPLARAVKIADLEDNMDVRRLGAVGDEEQARLAKYHRSWKRLTAAG